MRNDLKVIQACKCAHWHDSFVFDYAYVCALYAVLHYRQNQISVIQLRREVLCLVCVACSV